MRVGGVSTTMYQLRRKECGLEAGRWNESARRYARLTPEFDVRHQAVHRRLTLGARSTFLDAES